jgi:hypothetical protein
MHRMRSPARARLACFVSLGILSFLTSHARASETTLIPWFTFQSPESSLKIVRVRQLARKLLHWGGGAEHESSISLGPACAQLFWQKKWKWPEAGREQRLPGGSLGGPMLSIALPLKALGRLFSIETRLSSYHYVSVDLDSRRTLLDELGDPHDQSQSVEGGLYFTMSLAGLF